MQHAAGAMITVHLGGFNLWRASLQELSGKIINLTWENCPHACCGKDSCDNDNEIWSEGAVKTNSSPSSREPCTPRTDLRNLRRIKISRSQARGFLFFFLYWNKVVPVTNYNTKFLHRLKWRVTNRARLLYYYIIILSNKTFTFFTYTVSERC